MSGVSVERVLGVIEGKRRGPTIVVTAGIHGNEPAGLPAAARVLARLGELRAALRGKVIVLAGNRAALALGHRFIDRDLNRRWTAADLAALAALPEARRSSEDREQLALATLFDEIAAAAEGPVTFLDLHTTSGTSSPFVAIADTLANRAVALALPLPIVLGLEEVIDGSMLGWLVDRGHAGMALEGGRHDDEAAVDQHTAAVWLVLAAAGALRARDVPDLATCCGRLHACATALPRVLEVRHRHVVAPDDDFVMEPGWQSFAPVARGAVVARDRRGPIRAPEDGRILLPRYQPQGEDGFFVVRDVRPFWLGVSAALRRSGADRLVPLLPGVVRDAAGHLVTRPGWTPPRVVEVMHLCGYRRERADGERLVFSRRGDRRR